MRITRTHIIVAAAVALAAAALLAAGPAFVTPRIPAGWQPVVVSIPHGMGAGRIAVLLSSQGVIEHQRYFKLVAMIRGINKKLKAGRYKFSYPLSAWEAVHQLASGAVAYNTVTVPEGFTAARIAEALRAVEVDSARFMALCRDTGFARSLGIPSPGLEGYLFPSTYEVEWAAPADRVARLMAGHCLELFTPEWKAQMAKDKRSLHQIVTMASLIEAEAQVDSERAIVASVFYNRLRLKRPLESCASIEYILPRHKKYRLTFNDLKRPSPYNTYLNRGLPPGPICSPGKKSIEAAIFPARTNYLYFVAKGDGGHVFSTSLTEHARAKYIINKMKNRQE